MSSPAKIRAPVARVPVRVEASPSPPSSPPSSRSPSPPLSPTRASSQTLKQNDAEPTQNATSPGTRQKSRKAKKEQTDNKDKRSVPSSPTLVDHESRSSSFRAASDKSQKQEDKEKRAAEKREKVKHQQAEKAEQAAVKKANKQNKNRKNPDEVVPVTNSAPPSDVDEIKAQFAVLNDPERLAEQGVRVRLFLKSSENSSFARLAALTAEMSAEAATSSSPTPPLALQADGGSSTTAPGSEPTALAPPDSPVGEDEFVVFALTSLPYSERFITSAGLILRRVSEEKVVVCTDRDRARSMKYNNFKRAILLGEAARIEAERLRTLGATTPVSKTVIVNTPASASAAAINASDKQKNTEDSDSEPQVAASDTKTKNSSSDSKKGGSKKKDTEKKSSSKKSESKSKETKGRSSKKSEHAAEKKAKQESESTVTQHSAIEAASVSEQVATEGVNEIDPAAALPSHKKNTSKKKTETSAMPVEVLPSTAEALFWEALVSGNATEVNSILAGGEVVLQEYGRQQGRMLFSLDELPVDLEYTGTEFPARRVLRTDEIRLLVDGDTVVLFR